jgi:hypothetical protein
VQNTVSSPLVLTRPRLVDAGHDRMRHAPPMGLSGRSRQRDDLQPRRERHESIRKFLSFEPVFSRDGRRPGRCLPWSTPWPCTGSLHLPKTETCISARTNGAERAEPISTSRGWWTGLTPNRSIWAKPSIRGITISAPVSQPMKALFYLHARARGRARRIFWSASGGKMAPGPRGEDQV